MAPSRALVVVAVAAALWVAASRRLERFGNVGRTRIALPAVLASLVAATLGSAASTDCAIGTIVTGAGAVTDVATGLIFNEVVAIGLGASLLTALPRGVHAEMRALAGAAIAFGSLAVPYACTRGRGIGFGDVKLGAVVGASLGAVPALHALAGAFVAGALWSLPTLVTRGKNGCEGVAFAPFLAAGTAAVALTQWHAR